jgi:branched-chain amino acid transport system substrate-binding protein
MSMNNLRITRRVAISATLVLGTSPLLAQSNRNIVLGQAAPFTGAAAQLGIQYNAGAQLYFDALNARGGVNGRKIELRTLDDGYEPERTAAHTKQFIQDGVFALFGYVGTPTTLAALPLATEAKIPLFAPFTGAVALREPFNRYAIHIRASYDDETQSIVQHVQSIGVKKIAVFHQNDAYGRAGLEGVKKALIKTPQALVATAMVERNSIEVAAAVKTIATAQPDIVVLISAYKSCASFIRAAKAAGFSGSFYNVSFVGTSALSSELGKDAAGVVISQVMPYPYGSIKKISGEYLALLQASGKANLTPNYSSMEGFIAAKVFHEALKKTGAGGSRESFIDAVESIKNYDIGGFYVDFARNKHVGSHFVDLTMLTGDGKVRR